mmetsp:Transcript_60917/g.163094  ORF Transcript_60917/g.163094 Transcript_60917/m.163094 type:complete len:85 (-) Transcript_60917:697-951(-)
MLNCLLLLLIREPERCFITPRAEACGDIVCLGERWPPLDGDRAPELAGWPRRRSRTGLLGVGVLLSTEPEEVSESSSIESTRTI